MVYTVEYSFWATDKLRSDKVQAENPQEAMREIRDLYYEERARAPSWIRAIDESGNVTEYMED